MSNENNSSAPLKTAGEPFVALGECIADQVCLSVAELPDRDSPADWPQAMLVTSDELRNIVLNAINYAAQAVAAQAAPAAVAVPPSIPGLSGDAALAYEQCRAVVHLALAVADVYSSNALIVASDSRLADQIGAASAGVMEYLGDTLNSTDATTEEDEWLEPIFESAQKRWPATEDSSAGDLVEVQAEPVAEARVGQDEAGKKTVELELRYGELPPGIHQLYTAPQAQPADALDAEIAKLKKTCQELGNMFHDQIVAQQAAWIEWQHGAGAEAGMQWIENGLCGPGHIPDEDEPYGTEAQAYFDANKSDPFPACYCGRPSNILWMGKGFCSDAHHDEHRAAMAAAQEGGKA